jgi:hypothetical protein
MGRIRCFLVAFLTAGLLGLALLVGPGLAAAQYGTTFSGQVVDTNSQPVAGATIDVGSVGSVNTDSNGNFSLNVPAGSYTVALTRGVGGNVYYADFGVDLSSSLTGQVLTVPVPVTLTVQVTDPNGNPVPSAAVQAYGSCNTASFDIMPGVSTIFRSDGFSWGGTADSNGQFSQDTLPCATATGQLTAYPSQSSGLVQASVNFPTYTTNDSLTIVVYSVEGVVTSSSHAPIANATITLTSSPGSARAQVKGSGSATATTYTTVTNSSGFFGMQVPAGSYKLTIKAKTNGKSEPTNYSVTVNSVTINGTNLGTMAIPSVTAKIKIYGPSKVPVTGATVAEACTRIATLSLSSTLTGQGTTCDHVKTSARGVGSMISLPTPSATITITPPATSGLCPVSFPLNLSANTSKVKTLSSGCS